MARNGLASGKRFIFIGGTSAGGSEPSLVLKMSMYSVSSFESSCVPASDIPLSLASSNFSLRCRAVMAVSSSPVSHSSFARSGSSSGPSTKKRGDGVARAVFDSSTDVRDSDNGDGVGRGASARLSGIGVLWDDETMLIGTVRWASVSWEGSRCALEVLESYSPVARKWRENKPLSQDQTPLCLCVYSQS